MLYTGQKFSWTLKAGGTVTAELLKWDEDAILNAIVNHRAIGAGSRKGGAVVTRLDGAVKLRVVTIRPSEQKES